VGKSAPQISVSLLIIVSVLHADRLHFDASLLMKLFSDPFLSMMSETVASRKLVSYKRAIKDMKNDEESSYQGRAKS